MSTALFLMNLAAMAGGLGLLHYRRRKAGAAVLGLSIALFMALMPWATFNRLMKDSKRFHAWAEPRLWRIRGTWGVLSLGFGSTVGLFVALAKPKAGRKEGWEAPDDFPDLDKTLKQALMGQKFGDATLLGRCNGDRDVVLEAAQREGHMQIVGPTRSGKSQLLFALAGQDMHKGMPVLLMEAKGDRSDFDQFLKLAAWSGRVGSVRYFNPQDPRSMTFNPIRMVPGQDPTAIANQIARILGREPTSSGEGQDYYRSIDYAKIQNMAEVFCATGLQFTIRDCFYYFGFQTARAKAFELCEDRRLVGIAEQGFKDSPDSTSLTSALRPWTTGTLGRLLNTYSPQIRLEDVFLQGQLAYFAIPIGHLQVLANPLGRMIISGLLSVASWRQKAAEKPRAATVIMDEFAEFATPAFASFIATVGSARLWTILSHQDLGQLKKVQGMDAAAFSSAVFNNTSGCKVCFRAPDPEDAEFWASTLGTYSTFDDTERIQSSFLGDVRTGERSRRMVEQFRIHPNRLKNLTPGTAMVFAPGKEDCLIRTAAVRGLLAEQRVPSLTLVEGYPADGLELESEVKDPGGARQMDGGGDLP